MAGRAKVQMATSASSRIENLNAIVPRINKQKSKGKTTFNLGLHPAMRVDYTAILKENEILEESLEDHLVHIKRNEKRAMEEKGEELDEMRRQMEVITKLQEVVNSRNPGDSTEILNNDRALRLRQWAGENRSRCQLKLQAERDKFSSKNLFNVRRFNNSFDFLPSKRFISSTALQMPEDKEDDYSLGYNEATSPKLPKPKHSKGYLKKTISSLAGFRPMTANVTYQSEQKEDDLLPPRSKSAVLVSRSRRQLELLCRVATKEEPEVTADFKIDWKVVNEKRRRRKLQELKIYHEEIEDKINGFLRDVDLFNKRPISGKEPELKSVSDYSFSKGIF